MSAREKQVGGDHYSKHTIQPIDIIDDHHLDFYEGNAVKYILRYKDKNGIEDLEKAKHYIDLKIERLKRNSQHIMTSHSLANLEETKSFVKVHWKEIEDPGYLEEDPRLG